MLIRRTWLILALVSVIQLAVGCSREAPTAANKAVEDPANANRSIEPGMEGAKDNADELRTLIKLPYEPEDLAWKDYGPAAGEKAGRRRLLAVLQFTPEDTHKLVEAASKIRPGVPVSLSSEKWFPKELVMQSEMSSEDGIQATAYSAEEFLQPPFTEGTIARVNNTDFFVLEAFAK